MPAKTSQERFLGRPVKVNDDIPAENYVEFILEAEIITHEIQPAELYFLSEFRSDPHEPFFLIFASQQIFFLEVHGNRSGTLFRINRKPGRFQDTGGNVGGQDLKIKAWTMLGEILKDHGQCIGLLACGTAGAPDPQTSLVPSRLA